MRQTASPTEALHQIHTLPNGLTVLFDRVPHVRSASVGLWIKTGSAHETDDQQGITHLLEHLFFKGTKSRSARQLVAEIEGKGGHLNAFTARDSTCLYARVLDIHVETAVEILADIIKNSQFRDFDRERNVVLEEIASAEDVPEDYAHDLFVLRLWPHHPLGRPITGSSDSVARLTPDDVRTYYSSRCVPENMLLAVAGNFDEEAVLERIRREFEGPRRAPAPDGLVSPHFGNGITTAQRDIGQCHLCFGFPGTRAGDGRHYATEMLASVLGGGSTSRLFDRIREQEGLAYSIYAFRSSYHLAGLVGVYAAVAPESLAPALELACEELNKLCESGVPEDEVGLNREQLRGSVLMALESTFNRMARMAKSMIYHGRILSIEEVLGVIEAVTAKDLQQLAQNAFTADRCAMAILGPRNGYESIEVVPL